MNCPEFIATSLAVRTATHMAHLTARTYAAHKALGSFYETLTDLIDRYAEAHMGENRVVSLPVAKPPTDAPAELLTDFLAVVREKLAAEEGHKTKETILAEIEELILSTLYMLKLT